MGVGVWVGSSVVVGVGSGVCVAVGLIGGSIDEVEFCGSGVVRIMKSSLLLSVS